MSESKRILTVSGSNRVYDILKYIAQIGLPALATLYFALSQLWNLPHGAEIVGTITAFDTFLGVMLGISSTAYHNSDERFDGALEIIDGEDKKVFSLNVDGDPYEFENKSEVVFKVKVLE